MLSNAYFLAKFRFDTAENEPAKKLQNFRKMHFSKVNSRTPKEAGAGARPGDRGDRRSESPGTAPPRRGGPRPAARAASSAGRRSGARRRRGGAA